MNLKTQIISDINKRAQIKLAGFAEMKPYLANALLGGATLSAFTALPALLHAYSNDEDALKTLAEVSKYSMPVGALLGAGATGASQMSRALMDSASTVGNKAEEAVKILAGGISDAGNGIGKALSGIGNVVGGVGNEITGGLKEIATLPRDLGFVG